MKQEEKKQASSGPIQKPAQQTVKQSSGDKAFDNAIDLLLKKPMHTAPMK